MEVFSYHFPEDYPDRLIGVYDRESGDTPHNLLVPRLEDGWVPPRVDFEIDPADIDPIPSTNLPLVMMRNDLASTIKTLAPDDVSLIPIPVRAAGHAIDAFSIVHPRKSVEIWDLGRSRWQAMEMDAWPDDQPFFLEDMVLKANLEFEPLVAYNAHWQVMVVFREVVADAIRNSGSWVTVFSPNRFSNQ